MPPARTARPASASRARSLSRARQQLRARGAAVARAPLRRATRRNAAGSSTAWVFDDITNEPAVLESSNDSAALDGTPRARVESSAETTHATSTYTSDRPNRPGTHLHQGAYTGTLHLMGRKKRAKRVGWSAPPNARPRTAAEAVLARSSSRPRRRRRRDLGGVPRLLRDDAGQRPARAARRGGRDSGDRAGRR